MSPPTPHPALSATQIDLLEAQQQRLRRMRMVPTALLILMAVLFVLMLILGDPLQGYGLAFTEAAMVGALADWFAVVALFKHPLGLPIPHTAIIPRRKDEIGNNLAAFVGRNFLTESVIRERLRRQDLTGRIAGWLSQAENAERVSGELMRFLGWWLRAFDQRTVRRFVVRTMGRQLAEVDLATMAGRLLDVLTRDGRHHALVTQLLRQAVIYLQSHKRELRARIRDESPWWMPGFIDDRIADQLIERVKTVLFSMALDPQHELRQRLDQGVARYVHELKHSPELRVYAETLKKDALANPDISRYLEQLLEAGRQALLQQAEDAQSPFRQVFADLLQRSATELSQDRRLRRLLNTWLTAAIVEVVNQHGEQLVRLISETIATWDAQATARLIELQVGPDLQFIRINGTLVGGLVGLVIHALVSLIGH